MATQMRSGWNIPNNPLRQGAMPSDPIRESVEPISAVIMRWMSSSHDALLGCGGGFDRRGLIFEVEKGVWSSQPLPTVATVVSANFWQNSDTS
jgi:hypothetical protein